MTSGSRSCLVSSTTRARAGGAPARRAFLLGAAGATVMAASPRAAGALAPRPRRPGLKLGLASYSLRKLSIEQVLQVCRDNRITHLTCKDIHLPREPAALAQARAAYAEAGIALAGAGVIYMKNDEAAVRADFEYARAAGVPLIVAAPDPDALDLVERMIKEFGIPVAIHNHGPEDKHYPAPRDILRWIGRRDRRLGVCMDIGHTVRAGADPIRCVAECGPRLFDLHVKDLRNPTDKGSQTEVGKGVLDIPGLLRALVRRRFAGHVALEYEINADDPVPGVKESLAYLRGVLAGLGAA